MRVPAAFTLLPIAIAACHTPGGQAPAPSQVASSHVAAPSQDLPTARPPRSNSPTTSSNGLTLESFNRLQLGMSYREVAQILGAPGQVQMEYMVLDTHHVQYEWSKGFEKVLCSFENDELTQRMQFNLKAREQTKESASTQDTAVSPSPPPRRLSPTKPYAIIASEDVPGTKRSLDVRIPREMSQEQLEEIATELKALEEQSYARTFICYYLPGMKIGSGAWATTHFNPDLEVRILGFSAKEEPAPKSESSPTGGLIGRWLDRSPIVGGPITIRERGGKLYIERRFKDGSSFEVEVVEKKSRRGRHFEAVERSRAGDHWVIDTRGDLQIRDREGLIATARSID